MSGKKKMTANEKARAAYQKYASKAEKANDNVAYKARVDSKGKKKLTSNQINKDKYDRHATASDKKRLDMKKKGSNMGKNFKGAYGGK